MTDRFAACLPLILAHECGFTNDPRDPGGPTNFGITQATWAAYIGHPVTVTDMQNLTGDQVAPVYRARFWDAAFCDKLPPGLDYMVFDCAVNQGVGRAIKTLQQMLGVPADDSVGPKTMLAIRGVDAKASIATYAALREAFYRSLSTFPTFGHGWLNRLAEVKAQAMEWSA